TRVLTGEPNAVTALEVLAGGSAGAVRMGLRPRTGRTHQLRAQLAARGAPILGEDLYPSPDRARPPAPLGPAASRLQLPARGLSFVDPVTGEHREFRTAQELAARPRPLGP